MKTQALMEVLDCTPNANEIVDRLLFGYVEQLRKRLKDFLVYCVDSSKLDYVLSLLNSLPESFRSRILVSDELSDWLWEHGALTGDEVVADADQILGSLQNILRREELVCELLSGNNPKSTEFEDLGEAPIWSALGDWIAFKSDDEWKLKRSPTVGNTIAVDFDSPLALRHEPRSGVLNPQRLEFTDTECSIVLTKLNMALNNIDQILPDYGALIRNFTRRIIVRKSVESSNKGPHSSEQVPHQCGAIRILNPHLDTYTVTLLMETLLHESIHNFLTSWETINGDFVSGNQDYRPVSPWSGNPIPNPSFVHAIFVYYACHKLFSLIPSRVNICDEVDPDAAKLRLSTFATGFLVRAKVSDMLLLNEPLEASLRDTIDSFELKIRDFYADNVQWPVQQFV
jgi:hypothetical protein